MASPERLKTGKAMQKCCESLGIQRRTLSWRSNGQGNGRAYLTMISDKGEYNMKHPIDDPKFREWMQENDMEPNDMAYGIYDSKWTELYEQYKEDVAH